MSMASRSEESDQDSSNAPLLHGMDYRQLPGSGSEKSGEPAWQPTIRDQPRQVSLLVQTGVFALLLISNLGWILTLYRTPAQTAEASKYPPHKITHTAIFQDTTYGGIDAKKPQADALWRALFPSGNGLVSISKSDREAQRLSETWPDPDTPGNGLFFMAGYHNLHCLVKIRTSVFQFHAQENQSEPWAHIVHCIDQIRQTMICNFDTTLVPMNGPKEFIDGNYHVCKDYLDIFDWAGQHRPVVAPEDEKDEKEE